MPRKCQVCESEFRLQASAEIRQGITSHGEIAERYGLSVDSVQRHAKHMGKGKTIDPHALLSKIIAETSEIASAASIQGDVRGSLEAHQRSLSALSQLLDLEAQDRASENKPEPVWKGDTWNPEASFNDLKISDFDKLIEKVEHAIYPGLDYTKSCALCGRLGSPRGIFENPENHG